jgi:hypothetical protein
MEEQGSCLIEYTENAGKKKDGMLWANRDVFEL